MPRTTGGALQQANQQANGAPETQQAVQQGTPQGRTRGSDAGRVFAAWYAAQLVRTRFATHMPGTDRAHLAYGAGGALARRIWPDATDEQARAFTNALGNTLRGSLPRPDFAAQLARAVGLHPMAGLYHAGYMGLGDVAEIVSLAQLLGPQPLHFIGNDEEYQEQLAGLNSINDAGYRAHLQAQFEQELAVSQRLRDALGLTYEEWQQFAAYLNANVARDRLRHDLLGAEYASAPALPPLPSGYGEAENRFSGPSWPSDRLETLDPRERMRRGGSVRE